MKTYTLRVNAAHKEIFANTWMYNSRILKRFAVSLKGRNTLLEKDYSVKTNFYVQAYTEAAAAEMAVISYYSENIKNCVITEAVATAQNIVK